VWTTEDDAIRLIVLDCLSTLGSRYATLTPYHHRVARELADGLGPLHPVQHASLVWDWTHVLDSTPGGYRRIYEFLRAEAVI
jgi:hypothetical protein